MAIENQRIEKKFIILCEGKDVESFLINFLNSDALIQDARYSNDVQALLVEGNSNFSNKLGAVKNMENFEDVTRIMILRDAEQNVEGAVKSVQQAFRKNKLPVPDGCNQWKSDENNTLLTAFTLLPACTATPVAGTLEDLCWEILNEEGIVGIKTNIQTFLETIKQKYQCLNTYEHKGRVHTFFSINDKFVSLKVGEAAKAGAFNWANDRLAPLRDLISEGFSR